MIIYEVWCDTDIDYYRNLFFDKPEVESFEYVVEYDIDYFEAIFAKIKDLHEVENIKAFLILAINTRF